MDPIRRRCAALLLLLLCPFSGWAQIPSRLERQTDPLFGVVTPATPGAAVLVAQNGTVLFEKGYGLARLSPATPITPVTRFRIGSITKQFTAAAILKLAEDHRLSLEDRLAQYFPDWPKGDEVTLRQLLNHTSGIHDFTQRNDFSAAVTQPVTLAALIASFRRDPFDFEPGQQYRYDNSGYALLKSVIERVSGRRYEEFLRLTFFEPLGMKRTRTYPFAPEGPADAIGYAFENGAVHPAPNWHPSRLPGAGELGSTARDLFLWNEALFGGKVLSAASLRAAFTVGAVGGDDPTHPEDTGYGCGLIIDRLRGEREISHGGELAGFGSYLLRLPQRSLTVVVLLNCVPQMPALHQWNLAREIAARAAGLPPAAAPRIDTGLTEADYRRIAGRYDLGNLGAMTVSVEGRHAFFALGGRPKMEIFPISDRRFVVAGGEAEATFVRGADGRVVKAILKQAGGRIDARKTASL